MTEEQKLTNFEAKLPIVEEELKPSKQKSEDSEPKLNGKKQSLPAPEATPDLKQPTGTSEKSVSKRPTSGDKLAARAERLYPDVVKAYAGIGFLLTRWDTYDGLLIITESEKRAKELLRVAQHHKGMMDTIERIVGGNDYIALATGHGLMLYAILAHHGRIKGDQLFLAQIGYHERQIVPDLEQAEPVS